MSNPVFNDNSLEEKIGERVFSKYRKKEKKEMTIV